MTYPTSDERYHESPKPDDGLDPHLIVHGVIVALYVASPFMAWVLQFHPFSASYHGWLMWTAAVLIALVAFGPSLNAREQGNVHGVYFYKKYISPILCIASVLGLVALWWFAFSEAYAGSVFV